MASDTVCIPKAEFDFLVKCKQIVESDFEEKYSKEFVAAVKESEEAYKKGDFVRFKSVKEAKAFFDKA